MSKHVLAANKPARMAAIFKGIESWKEDGACNLPAWPRGRLGICKERGRVPGKPERGWRSMQKRGKRRFTRRRGGAERGKRRRRTSRSFWTGFTVIGREILCRSAHFLREVDLWRASFNFLRALEKVRCDGVQGAGLKCPQQRIIIHLRSGFNMA